MELRLLDRDAPPANLLTAVRAAVLGTYPGARIERLATVHEAVHEADVTTRDGRRLRVKVDGEFRVVAVARP